MGRNLGNDVRGERRRHGSSKTRNGPQLVGSLSQTETLCSPTMQTMMIGTWRDEVEGKGANDEEEDEAEGGET